MKQEQIRLQKYLADRGVASRRKAEELIQQGMVKVNGRPVKLGDKVNPARDLVTVGGKRVTAVKEKPCYIMLYKPRDMSPPSAMRWIAVVWPIWSRM